MNYAVLKVRNKEFKLRIDTRASIALEKKLGTNPLNILMTAQEGKLPSLEHMLLILHASMQKFHHGVTVDKLYDIFDAYLEEGNDLTDFMNVIMEILSCSGYMKLDRENVIEQVPEEVKEEEKKELELVKEPVEVEEVDTFSDL